MESVEEWPEVVEYEWREGDRGEYLTLRLRYGIRVQGEWSSPLDQTTASVWTLAVDNAYSSFEYRTLVFGKEKYAIEEGDTAAILVEMRETVEEAFSLGLVKLLFQTVEVGDVAVR